ncbi:MAG: thermonuclease family protein [Alphaproteobacteria bacterium]|nr:thermonuclease family protein [Alphaproteobacteria bacterium]
MLKLFLFPIFLGALLIGGIGYWRGSMTTALVGSLSFLGIGLVVWLMAKTSLDLFLKVLKYALIMAILGGLLLLLVRACSRSVPPPRRAARAVSRMAEKSQRSIPIPPMPIMQVSVKDRIKNLITHNVMPQAGGMLSADTPPPAKTPRVYTYQSSNFSGVAGVVYTGAIFSVGGHIIKLYGIDAPMLEQRCISGSGSRYDCGRLSRQALNQMIGGRTIACRTIIEDDRRNYVATCTLGEKDIASEMVAQGWAVINRRTTNMYAGEEARARQNGLGLWGGRFMMPGKYRTIKNQVPTLRFYPKQFKKPYKWGWF